MNLWTKNLIRVRKKEYQKFKVLSQEMGREGQREEGREGGRKKGRERGRGRGREREKEEMTKEEMKILKIKVY